MSKITYVFPAVAVVYLVMLFADYYLCRRSNSLNCVTPVKLSKKLKKRDFIALAVITAVYGVVAFINLGSNKAPESFCHFTERGQYSLIELSYPQTVTKLRYYCGLETGYYRLQLSEDGENWSDMENMEQESGDVFKWKDAVFTEDAPVVTRFIRLVCSDELYLGELAVYGADYTVLPVEELVYTGGSCQLFDEQDTVPDELSYINSSYFDEVYHARTASENIENIYPYEVSHPPLGKLIISIGLHIFGTNPFGWRFMGTLFGVLMLPAVYIFLKKLFGGVEIPFCCTTVFAFDFMHYTQTRIATIDTYAVFFIILMYLFMYCHVRRKKGRGDNNWCLALSGVCFGLGAASKWTCIYAGGGLGVIWLLDWIRKFTVRGEETDVKAIWKRFFKNCLFCVVFFVIIPCIIYYMSYYPYGKASGMSGIGMYFKSEYMKIVLDNQRFMLSYHNGVTSSHPYSSRWYQWIFDIRPILYYLNYSDEGRSSFGCFNNPLLCWGGIMAIAALIRARVKGYDRNASFILVGYLAQLVPWMIIGRTTFEYHYFPCTFFLVLAMGYVFSRIRECPEANGVAVRSFTIASVLLFIAFYPVLSGMRIDPEYGTKFLKWLPTWPF